MIACLSDNGMTSGYLDETLQEELSTITTSKRGKGVAEPTKSDKRV